MLGARSHFLSGAGRFPGFWILLRHGRVVIGRRVMKIHSYGRRSQEHVHCNTARRWLRNPRPGFQGRVLPATVAVVNSITWVIDVVVLHHDGWRCDHDGWRSNRDFA